MMCESEGLVQDLELRAEAAEDREQRWKRIAMKLLYGYGFKEISKIISLEEIEELLK